MDNRQAQGPHLPNEILLRIVQYTHKSTLKSLRLANRALRTYTDPCFAITYFSYVGVLTTKPALERLQAICNSPSIAPHIMMVAFHTLKPASDGPQKLDCLREEMQRHQFRGQSKVAAASRALTKAISEYESFYPSMLEAIQKSFQGLRCNENHSVIIATYEDIVFARLWKSIGWNADGYGRIERALFNDEFRQTWKTRPRTESRLNRSRLWEACSDTGARIMLAWARSGLSSTRLSCSLEPWLVSSSWPQQKESLRNTDKSSLSFLCDELQHIGRDLAILQIRPSHFRNHFEMTDDCALARIMKSARRLETLNISRGDNQESDGVLIHSILRFINPNPDGFWRCDDNFLDSLQGQHLRNVHLARIFVSTEDVVKLLRKIARTLTSLVMDKVVLDGDLRVLKTLRLDQLEHLEMIGVKVVLLRKYFTATSFLRVLEHHAWDIEGPRFPQVLCAIKPGTRPSKCLRHDSTRAIR